MLKFSKCIYLLGGGGVTEGDGGGILSKPPFYNFVYINTNVFKIIIYIFI